ncbi:DUF2968 domain-containing protein [Burkholderia latens]|uniref:DUF2968 domain-containing protein n=1 Tax=Burkholderia latens TaxID=488446 RepID=A0A6H9SXY2_9BURK|nr:DUF2968 domain-containing protein [Burkholderia latens]KAB0644803.1 DUF2968 domain-containing protein [Burkholderia latens]VWB17163.1 lipoprotein [Burkholderia latens]
MKLHLNNRPLEAADPTTEALFDTRAELEPAPADDTLIATPTVSPLRSLNAVLPQGAARTVQTAELAEIEAMHARDAVTVLRTLETFSYAVKLLLHRADMSYYVTLHQEGKLWRALHGMEFDTAEAAFKYFEEQAVRLADVELRRAQLEAQNQQIAAMADATEGQAERLRIDLERHAEQTQLVNNRQQQVRKDVSLLEAQRAAAQAQLNKAVRLIHQLRTTSNERVPHLPLRRTDGS